jgi:hypothetical protein
MADVERLRLLSIARELYGRLVWSHKVHEKDRERASIQVAVTKWVNVFLSFLTAIFAVYSVVSDAESLRNLFSPTWITVFFSAGITAFTVWQLSFDPSRFEADHRQTAKRLLVCRDKMLFIIHKLMGTTEPIANVEHMLEGVSNEICLTYEFAPDTSTAGYNAASKALKSDEEMTLSSIEIDSLLPESLRSSSTSSNSNP